MANYDFEALDLMGDVPIDIPETSLKRAKPMSMQETLGIMKSSPGGIADGVDTPSGGVDAAAGAAGMANPALGGIFKVIGKGIAATEAQKQRALDSRLNQVLTTAAAMSRLGSGV